MEQAPLHVEPPWAKLSDLKAGDTIELHGFDCASGTVTVEQDVWGDLFFPCAKGRHFVTGQLDDTGHLIGITIRPAEVIDPYCDANMRSETSPAATITSIPITQERTTMDINTDDANSVSRFFQSIADKVVLASTLPAEVAELRKVVEALKADVEQYREHNARMDEEITNLRRERAQLQDDNAQLQHDLGQQRAAHELAESRWNQACQERDRWHDQFISLSEANETAKRERDDAQMKIMELEDQVRMISSDRDVAQRQCDEALSKLSSIRSALA